MNYSTNILSYILSPTTTTLARMCFMLFTCFYYSFITRSNWYFCCLSIRFTDLQSLYECRRGLLKRVSQAG